MRETSGESFPPDIGKRYSYDEVSLAIANFKRMGKLFESLRIRQAVRELSRDYAMGNLELAFGEYERSRDVFPILGESKLREADAWAKLIVRIWGF
jgi:hypothetical protein